jgi:hypothetical protein
VFSSGLNGLAADDLVTGFAMTGGLIAWPTRRSAERPAGGGRAGRHLDLGVDPRR